MIRAFNFLLVFFALCLATQAQVSKPGFPPSFSIAGKLHHLNFETLAPIEINQLAAEDLIFDTLDEIPWRFGKEIYVDMDLKNSGDWYVFENGDRVWRLGIKSPGAFALTLIFNRYILPEGAELYIYNTDHSQVIGAFTDYNNQDDNYFATTLIEGEELVIEYFEPKGVAFPGELEIESVNHAYRDPFQYAKAFEQSGNCNINVACPEAEGWENQINSVALILVNGSAWCTGVLINNTAFDGRPLVLSANHCYKNPGSLVFWFNWQSATCNNPSASPPYDAVGGLVDRARNSASDFWLLEFTQSLPENINPYFSGWDRTLENVLVEPIIGIHHPTGDIKKFSYALDGVQNSSYLGAPGSGSTHWRITWSGGTTTEGGSSGSPIFDAQKRIIGQLHGGYAACGNTLADYYGRLGISWTGGGTPATRLSDWLDPLGTNAQAIDGFDPFAEVKEVDNFDAVPLSPSSIKLSWELNENQNPVLVAFSFNKTFGAPNGEYSMGQKIAGGGQVIYFGTAEEFIHQQLDTATNYNYKIWSQSKTGKYSDGSSAQATTFCMLTMISEGLGTTTPSSGDYVYPPGTIVNVTATPNPGWQFLHWEVNGQVLNNPELMVDLQGNTTATARFVLLAEPGYRLYPQPVRDWLFFEWNAPPGKIKVEVYNMNGQLMIRSEIETTQLDAYQTSIDLAPLIPGFYVIRIAGDGLSIVEKLFKL